MLYEAELYYPETERPVVRTFEARCHTEASNLILAEVRASRQPGENPIEFATVSMAVERDENGEIILNLTKKR